MFVTDVVCTHNTDKTVLTVRPKRRFWRVVHFLAVAVIAFGRGGISDVTHLPGLNCQKLTKGY